MYAITVLDGDTQYGVNEYVCDTPDDLVTLPRCAMGSIAIIISDSTVYMKNSKGEWVKL